MTMREVHIATTRINKRTHALRQFEASLHGRELKVPVEAMVEFTAEQSKKAEKAMKDIWAKNFPGKEMTDG